jgi:hypothetical protein
LTAITPAATWIPTRDWVIAAGVALALVDLAAGTAMVVTLVGDAEIRAWLDFSFAGLPEHLGEVVSILGNNLRILAGLLAACLVANLGLGISQDAASGVGRSRLTDKFARVVVVVCDCMVAGSAIAHALIIGAGIGAYGGRMVLALLPQGPLELAAYSLALALYVRARRTDVELHQWIAVAGVSVTTLLLAAPLEVFIQL